VSSRQPGRHARRPRRRRFQPEPIPAAVPGSLRGYFEAAPEPGRPGQIRVWLHGDGSRSKHSVIVLTHRDIRGLCWFLYRLTEAPETAKGSLLVSRRDQTVMYRAADHA
jgi:hypothetical protein